MPTSAPGSSRAGRSRPAARCRRGFTLIELLLVLALVAISAGVVGLALRDADAARLDEEGERLVALLETARAEARVTGATVRFVPAGGDGATPEMAHFRFVAQPALREMPTRWLTPGVTAQVVGGTTLLLGPDAILPPQRIVLRLGDRRLELGSDGLAPFAVVAEP